jgi:hypothetical protein
MNIQLPNKIKVKVVPVLFQTEYQAIKAYCETGASRPGCFTPEGKSPWYPPDSRLCGSQSRSGCGGEEKNSKPLSGL